VLVQGRAGGQRFIQPTRQQHPAPPATK
jgi:hypothetical protein